jgi:hypothetical protein
MFPKKGEGFTFMVVGMYLKKTSNLATGENLAGAIHLKCMYIRVMQCIWPKQAMRIPWSTIQSNFITFVVGQQTQQRQEFAFEFVSTQFGRENLMVGTMSVYAIHVDMGTHIEENIIVLAQQGGVPNMRKHIRE